jgi:hypothetical protein
MRLLHTMSLVRKEVTIQYESRLGICDWGLIMERTTQASVGTDPWTVIQNRLHPVVPEAEFTPLDWSCLRCQNPLNKSVIELASPS